MNPKALIIDLCGPLLTIDTGRIDRRLHALGVTTKDCYRTLYHEGKVKQFDLGLLSPAEFCDNMREVLHCDLDDHSLLDCWNDLIVDFDLRNIEALRQLGARYRLFLLSNSDVENEARFRQYINDKAGFDLFATCFEAAYFSNHLHLRKPDPAIFIEIMRRHGLEASETMLLDDCRQHCENARTVGLQARQCSDLLFRCLPIE